MDREKLINIVQHSDTWLSRRRALIALSHQHDPTLYDLYIHALTDPVGEVRHAAILALSRLGQSQAVAELAKPRFLQSPHLNIRWATVRALGQLGDTHIIDRLFHLVDDQEWLVRNEAMAVMREKIRILVQEGDPARASILIRMLGVKDKEIVDLAIQGLIDLESACMDILIDALKNVRPGIRRHAAFVLGEAREDRATSNLIDTLEDQNPQVRAAAVTALGKIQDKESLKHLVSMLGEADRTVCRAIVDAVIRFGANAIPYLHSALHHSRDKAKTSAIIQALGELRQPSSMPLIMDHLSSTYFTVRTIAVKALSRYGSPVIDSLLSMLNTNRTDISELLETARDNPVLDNRLRAIDALGALQDHRAAELLKTLLEDDAPEISKAANEALVQIGTSAWGRCGALMILGEIGDESIVAFVVKALEDDSPHVRFESVKAIGRLNGKDANEQLIEVAKEDPVQEVRTEALRHLRELAGHTDSLFQCALDTLEDEQASVRLESTRILGDFVRESAIQPLMKRLADPVWGVRVSAENALCSYGDKIVPKLLKLIRHERQEARYRVISALGRLGDQRAVEPLRHILQNEDPPPKIMEITKQSLALFK
jgi:HEAT repeat protein